MISGLAFPQTCRRQLITSFDDPRRQVRGRKEDLPPVGSGIFDESEFPFFHINTAARFEGC
jgi:hypothetical protein